MFVQFDDLSHDAFTKQLEQRCSLYKAVVPDSNVARSVSFVFGLRTFPGKLIFRKDVSRNGAVTKCHSDAATTDQSVAATVVGRFKVTRNKKVAA